MCACNNVPGRPLNGSRNFCQHSMRYAGNRVNKPGQKNRAKKKRNPIGFPFNNLQEIETNTVFSDRV